MVEIAGGVSFPVVFYDGQRDNNIGCVVVSASTEFKNFQAILSKKIGISSHQFTVYLADYQRSQASATKIRRRIPITGKVNFGAISGERSSFFLVVLKRSKRERRRRVHEIEDDYSHPTTTKTKTQQPRKKNPPQNVMLLRRNNAGIENEAFSGFISPIMDRLEYEQRIRKMQLEKEKYLINMGVSKLSVGTDGGRNCIVECETVVCRDCQSAMETGAEVGFHCCANDAVTAGFRSQAGPIARPVK